MDELLELFNKLYNTNVYLANRFLLDFPDYLIEDLQRSGRYPNLFTPTLKNDLYKEKLKRLNIGDQLYNKIEEIQRRTNKSWESIYNISAILTHDDYPVADDNLALFTSIFNNNDLVAYEIAFLINFHESTEIVYHFIYEDNQSIYNAKKILLYLAKIDDISIDIRRFERILSASGKAAKTDLEYIQLFAKTLFENMKSRDPTFGGVGESHALFLIYTHIKDSLIYTRIFTKEEIDFFLNHGVMFGPYELRRINDKFGQEYTEEVKARSDENEN